LGGGTFDISILKIEHGLFSVLAIGGHTHLGGDDFDRAISEWLKRMFEQQNTRVKLPIETDDALRAKLREAAKAAKIALTDDSEYQFSLPALVVVGGEEYGLNAILTRTEFEELIRPFIDQSLQLVVDTLIKAKVAAQDLTQILLVGGQTHTPAVREAIQRRFCRPINVRVKPEEAVARGAAMLGARLCGYLKEQVSLRDVIPLSLGIELADGHMDKVIGANQQIPIEVWRRGPRAFTTQRDGQDRIAFRIYQGEAELAADNTYLGDVILPLATTRLKGEHRINCLFKVDYNGILTVRAESAYEEAKPAEVVIVHGVPQLKDEQPQVALVYDPSLGEQDPSL